MSNPLAAVSDASYLPSAAQLEINKLIPTSMILASDWVIAQKECDRHSDPDKFLRAMGDARVKAVLTKSVYVPQSLLIGGVERNLTLSPAILNKSAKKFDPLIGVLFSIPGEAIELRRRSGHGVHAAIEIYSNLSDVVLAETDCLYGTTKLACAAKSQNTYFVSGAPPAASMGRILEHYPKLNERQSIHFRVPTEMEALQAMYRSGLILEEGNYRSKYLWAPKDLSPEDYSDFLVSTNPKADCGLPMLGKLISKDGIDPVAQELLGALNKYMYTILEEAYGKDHVNGVDEQMKKWSREQPYLVASVGKTKADYYSLKKLKAASLRFYNVVPKPIGMIMSTASQVFESKARSVFQGSYSAQGITLSKGGCDKLMAEMERQLDAYDFAYVHCGDDSFVIYTITDTYYLLALDMTAFDLTQRGDVMQPVDNAIAEELGKINPVGAQVWRSYMREHLCVMNKSATFIIKDGGPSGVQLQSKRGDVIMDIVLNRLKEEFRKDPSKKRFRVRDSTEEVVAAVCATLGFKACRIEDFMAGNQGESLEVLFSRTAFKFLGYFIHHRYGHYVPMADVARQVTQMQYPGIKWVGDRKDLDLLDAARIGAIAFNFGVPTLACEKAVNALTTFAIEGLEKQYQKVGDRNDPRLGFVTSVTVFGIPTPASIQGLLRVLKLDKMLFWAGVAVLRLPRSLEDVDSGSEDSDDSEVFYLPTSSVPRRVEVVVRQSALPVFTKISSGKPFPPTKGTQIKETLRLQAQMQGLHVGARSFTPASELPFKGSARGRRKMQGRELMADERELQNYYDQQFRDEYDY